MGTVVVERILIVIMTNRYAYIIYRTGIVADRFAFKPITALAALDG